MSKIKTVNLLPETLRTDKNSRFLSSTLDQLVQKPELERINGFIGSKITPTYDSTSDIYLSELSDLSRKYNLEPAMVVYTTASTVGNVIDFDDLTNEIQYYGGLTDNLDRLYRSKYYSYDPLIDWDKFVNYQEYFWLTTGPDTIEITGTPKNSTSTYSVEVISNGFVFTPDGLTSNPTLTLYRGNVYNFDNLSGQNFYIKISPSAGTEDLYPVNVINNGTSTGVLSLTVDVNTPSVLYYSGDDQSLLGKIVVKLAKEDSSINVEKEVIGKAQYTSGNGVALSNGMKIKFGGMVTPEFYQNKEFFVEGVGEYIRLVNYDDLLSQSVIGTQFDDDFDSNAFDEYPFDNFKNLPITPEYITINRASRDLNPWTRYNRWFHKDIITISAKYNNVEPVYPANKRAQRPIIEFKPNIQLFNFGSVAIPNVDLFDNYETDPFKFIDGSNGYYVDGVSLNEGMTVIFNKATDSAVQGTVYRVSFINVKKNKRLVLTPILTPNVKDSVSINLGDFNQGKSFYFTGTAWRISQSHTRLNEAPYFDVFDELGNSYSNSNFHLSSFNGTKIFCYETSKTGVLDSVLGLKLKYKNASGIGSYLFKNFFTTDKFQITESSYATTSTTVNVSTTYLKINDERQTMFTNVWREAEQYQIPIYQFQSYTLSTSTVEINSIDNPGFANFTLDVEINSTKLDSSNYHTSSTGFRSFVKFKEPVLGNILFKIYTENPANKNGVYEPPLTLTNNPLNGEIGEFTLSEITDHVKTMVNRGKEWAGVFPGSSNLRDLPNIAKYGSRLISNSEPIAFAQMFLGNVEHSLETALRKVAIDYNVFKDNFFTAIDNYTDQNDPVDAVDQILRRITQNRTVFFPYYNSDMIAFGSRVKRTYNVRNSRKTIYPLASDFDPKLLSNRSVLVYINNQQKIIDVDYKFLVNEGAIEILIPLASGDVIDILDFNDTTGCFLPPTPTKLGMYPKFIPKIYLDTTYADRARNVIVGHDGSKFVAYNDFRDAIILEFEKRIYNNIKSNYRPELFNVHSVLPGAFRPTDYSTDEINQILQSDFIRWAGLFGLDYQANNTANGSNPFTYNYSDSKFILSGERLTGTWRGIYNYVYDTDYPHLEPWRMLGFYNKPDWWDAEYGQAPYTSENEILWDDLEKGFIRGGSNPGINPLYARPGLTQILPVDQGGRLVDPTVDLISNSTVGNRIQNWKFGDWGPVEYAWRTSSFYPFAIQRLLALTRPIEYSALMFDPSRMVKNKANHWVYSNTNKFINLKDVVLFNENNALTSGYSVLISEQGFKQNRNYTSDLRNAIDNFSVNLFHKVGGFVDKNKLRIIVDAIAPTSTDPGSLLPQENYQLIVNTSNPVEAVAASGIVVQKTNAGYTVRGYDAGKPYFNVLKPKRSASAPAITIGGVTESFVDWSYNPGTESNNLSNEDKTTAVTASTGNFYQQGQIVRYNGRFYRVKVSHASEPIFDSTLYTSMPSLPIKGGATVQIAQGFDTTETKIPYGVTFRNIQDVYDFIVGYGQWLTSKGFIFDAFSSELNLVIDWNFSAKEFLYWTTQNWEVGSLITLSPFATQVKFSRPTSTVDYIADKFYDYAVLSANGSVLPVRNLSVSRDDGTCIIQPVNTSDGIYLIYIRPVQKEHGMIFDNTTIFNDVIYDIETGYRQRRMKFVGFKTANWNGDYTSPGFVYDAADIKNWAQYTDYQYGAVVKFNNKYYSAANKILGSSKFDVGQGWILLDKKPDPDFIPNFDYKISQFLDFYSLDVDNFDSSQQKMAQHLVGYSPRIYMNNIIVDPVSQYKFYQGMIKEKGTKTAVEKISKATINNKQGSIDFVEEWAFRIGAYGSYSTYKDIEFPLQEGVFVENPQIVNLVNTQPTVKPNDLIYYVDASKILVSPKYYNPARSFAISTATFNENNFILPYAGYVRFDDVTSTAYNENSLLDIANNGDIKEGDTIWLGFKSDGDWDVLRYEAAPIRIIGVFVSAPGSSITFTTDYFHNFTIGDIVSVVDFNQQVNGIYKITDIPQLNQFTVSSSLTSIVNEPLLSPGLVYKFVSKRFKNFDDIPADSVLLTLSYDTKFWIDENPSGKWEVYKKTQNYTYNSLASGTYPEQQRLGWSITKKNNDDTLVVGAPDYQYYLDEGRVFVYEKIDKAANFKFSFTLNSESKTYHLAQNANTDFGYATDYDPTEFNGSGYGLFFVGAPSTENIYVNSNSPGIIRYAIASSSTTSTNILAGAVKISSVNPRLKREVGEVVLASPLPSDYERYGASLAYSTETSKLYIGAPGTLTTNSGRVYVYYLEKTGVATQNDVFTVIAETTSMSVMYDDVIYTPASLTEDTVGSQFGHSISISKNNILAIGAPGYNSQQGFVAVYNSGLIFQILSPPSTNTGIKNFGHKVTLSPDGSQLFVSAPQQKNNDLSYGVVYIYDYDSQLNYFNTSSYQVLINPVPGSSLNFGQDLGYNETDNSLVVSSLGTARPVFGYDNGKTTFDQESTRFYDSIKNVGAVYIYNRKVQRFVLADELKIDQYSPGSNFGHSVGITDTEIFVGAPAYNSTGTSALYQFNKIDSTVESWDLYRYQDDLVNLAPFRKITLFDTFKDEVLDYLDIIDPIKGKIAGIADQEIKFKSAYDPAVYSIGIAGTVVDTTRNWLDEHVGELWWDISSVKYVWYEQGDLSYRKNNWGQVFPGATIDVYEWVGSSLLPSEWSSQADTAEGLANNVSGQPKFSDNSVLSVKQIYNSITNSFGNYYYYWVKNTVLIPNVKNRRISAYQVASMIADPTSYGYKFISFISKDALTLANIGGYLVSNRIDLNIAYDVIDNKIPKHTEWLLINEGSDKTMPTPRLNKKLYDSLLGHDRLGNLVPDPKLNERNRYGIGIRPQQTFFRNRFLALREIVEYANSILLKNLVTGKKNFQNLNAKEDPPDEYSREWDHVVEDNEALLLVQTTALVQAQLTCTIDEGKVRSVQIVNPGNGYKSAPVVTLTNDFTPTEEAVIQTVIDDGGHVVGVEILNPGSGYADTPALTVRPYSIIVLADSLYNGKWTKFSWNSEKSEWQRVKTQKYNTPLYWNYVDWTSSDFDPFKEITFTIQEYYEIYDKQRAIPRGSYVKVLNPGDNLYIILEKIDPNIVGTFDTGYNLVYKQSGTIQLNNGIWDTRNNNLGYDKNNTYDQTLYDQTADLELKYILDALRNDLFVDDLKLYWNLLFFKAVKYALTEQPLLDWAFKTSFINVTNYAGELDQRPVYKLLNTEYYKDYLNEVKPFRTQVRTFTVNNEVLEPTNTFTTDFDLPAKYNLNAGEIRRVGENSGLLQQYPWKAWSDNFTFEVGSIVVARGGSNYVVPPVVSIETVPGDFGSGATAVAYISSGEVNKIVVTNPGQGYKSAPIIKLIGGGYTDLVPAIAAPIMQNNKVRTTLTKLKFDRIYTKNQIGSKDVVDSFICDGVTKIFDLNWVVKPDRLKIKVTINGAYVVGSDYTIRTFTNTFNGYTKQYSRIEFLEYAPGLSKTLEVSYEKSIDLYHAAERVLEYYNPSSGMAGKDLAQVMQGIEYPKTQIKTLGFDYTSKWDNTYEISNVPVYFSPFGENSYADGVSFYTQVTATSTGTVGSTQIQLSSLAGIAVGQSVNVSNTLTNKFDTSTVYVTSLNGGVVTLNTSITDTINIGDSIEFWTKTTDFSILDTIYDSGYPGFTTTNTGSSLQFALGINPEDIILDGDGFFTPDTSYSTEEFVPGESFDTIGINVYTKSGSGAPLIYSGKQYVPKSNQLTYLYVPYPPPTIESMVVTFNNKIFENTTRLDLVFGNNSTFYYYDFETNQIIVSPQSEEGYLGYSVVTVGGEGVVDNASTIVYESTDGQVESLAYYEDIKSAYVTVNGIIVGTTATNLTDMYYDLTYASPVDKRASVHVHEIDPSTPALIQAWFFDSDEALFNEVKEETYVIPSDTTATYIVISRPPAIIEPFAPQVIFEVSTTGGNLYRRLLPPFVTYYNIINTAITTFSINNTRNFLDYFTTNIGTGFTVQNVDVFVNGEQLARGFDYTVDADLPLMTNPTITLDSDVISPGDVLAIVAKPDIGWEFDIVNQGTLVFNSNVDIVPGATGGLTNCIGRIISYTNHDQMLMRTERFPGNTYRRFRISRQVLNNNFIWVTLNNTPLVNKIDFILLDDGFTIQISDTIYVTPDDEVIISSFSTQLLGNDLLGFRVFNDIFGRRHFKRLSKHNSTKLAQPLSYTDTEIYVEDASVLTPPSVSRRLPGVVTIAGERIEFYKVQGNVLSQLRRSTLGTGPAFYLEANTKVIDQGINQTIPFAEQMLVQNTLTTTATTYTISTLSNSIIGDGITLSVGLPSTTIDKTVAIAAAEEALRLYSEGSTVTNLLYDLNGDFIVDPTDVIGYQILADGGTLPYVPAAWSNYLSLFEKTYPIPATDQVAVYYGGRLLKKAGTFYHDTTKAYDSPNYNIIGNVTATTDLTDSTSVAFTIGNAYIVTSTNQVWVYKNSTELDAINGFVYRGLNYLPPEFSINTSTQVIKLNIKDGVQPNVRLSVVKKQFARSSSWNDVVDSQTTLSLLNSTTIPAKFLQARPAELPDSYYYGGPKTLTDGGQPLTDTNADPLIGI